MRRSWSFVPFPRSRHLPDHGTCDVSDGFAIRDHSLTVRNRWGECIFETGNERTGWDGTLRGMTVQVDVYVWQIELHACSFVGRKKMRGHVTVVR